MRNSSLILFVVAVLALCLSPFFGVASISFSNIFDAGGVDALIFWQIRAPRALLTFFTGGTLALSGLLFQTLFRNPLMTPFTLGVSSGATLGAAIAIHLGLGAAILGFSFVTLFGFLGAVLTVALLIAIGSRMHSFSNQSLLLLGVALSHFYAAILFVIYYTGSVLETHMIVRFTLGNLGISGFSEIIPVAVFSALLIFSALFFAPEIRLLSISEENARLKGVDSVKVVTILLVSISIAVGTVTSIAGPIGFVGLIIPHLLKKLFKKEASSLIPASFFGGAAFLLLCDITARSLGTQSEIPIGVITAALGGPFFIYLILSRR
jgi:iron complex transport system permease protein